MWQINGSGGVRNDHQSAQEQSKELSDSCKSMYDSHSDSGFLSGSNLVEDGNNSSSRDQQTAIGAVVAQSSSLLSHHQSPHNALSSQSSNSQQNTSTMLSSSSCIDSGIDISEQLSSLQLRSGPQQFEDESKTSRTSATPVPSQQQQAATVTEYQQHEVIDSHSSEQHISRSHVTLLREIFSPDKDGDT